MYNISANRANTRKNTSGRVTQTIHMTDKNGKKTVKVIKHYEPRFQQGFIHV